MLLISRHFGSRKQTLIPPFALLLSLLLFGGLMATAAGFCYPGCECSDEVRSVRCENASSITSIPILFNPMLRSLVLRNSQALKLDAISLSLYPELEVLDLSHNAIAELPGGLFASAGKLRELRLNNNRLKTVDASVFTSAYNLQALDLSHNRIENLERSTFSSMIDSLVELNLASNRLQSVNFLLDNMSKLRKLDLSGNVLVKLPHRFLPRLGALEQLKLSSNLLTEISAGTFTGLPRLQELDLSSNMIPSLGGEALRGLNSLRQLNLSTNMMSAMAANGGGGMGTWQYLHSLESLDISSNPVQKLANASFDGLRSLKSLRATKMDLLEKIEPLAFHSLGKLEQLAVSHCPILGSIDAAAFRRLDSLRHLDLAHNQLSSLAPDALNWRQLESLGLEGNQWSCDCQILTFLPQLLKKFHAFDVHCAMPESLTGVRIVDVKDVSLCSVPIDNQTLILFALGLASLGIALLLAILLLCVCRGRVKGCWENSSNANKSRIPLYATGSSFSESLIYEKQAEAGDRRLVMVPASSQQQAPFCPAQRFPRLTTDGAMENSSEYYSSILLPCTTNAGPTTTTPTTMPHRRSMFNVVSCHNCDRTAAGHHPSMTHIPAVDCHMACPPYMMRRVYATNSRARSNSCSRPPSFNAPPPPPSVPPPSFTSTLYRQHDNHQRHYDDEWATGGGAGPEIPSLHQHRMVHPSVPAEV